MGTPSSCPPAECSPWTATWTAMLTTPTGPQRQGEFCAMATWKEVIAVGAGAAAAEERRAAAGGPRSLQTVLTAAAVAGLACLVATGDPLPMMVARAAIYAAAAAAASIATVITEAAPAAAAAAAAVRIRVLATLMAARVVAGAAWAGAPARVVT